MEQTFKQHFVANFLSTWCALNFQDYCSRGMQSELENPPVEDAIFLANCAWHKLQTQPSTQREITHPKPWKDQTQAMYGIGQETAPQEFGMWYGPCADLDELLRQPGQDAQSVIVSLPGNGTDGTVCYRWRDKKWTKDT